MNPDYTHLYRDLGLQPGCSLEDFTRAYRRHVASLHPDRSRAAQHHARPHDPAALPLADVIGLYDQAMRFHRRYGRLPGASRPVAPPQTAKSIIAGAGPVADEPDVGDASQGEHLPAAGGVRRWWPWLVFAALVLLVLGLLEAPTRETSSQPSAADAPQVAPPRAVMPTMLALDMDAKTVLAIQGEPLQRRGDQWDYGPSWIRFDRGRLVDWYSSPFNRLQTATTSPKPSSVSE